MSLSLAMRSWTSMGNVSRLVAMEAGRWEGLGDGCPSKEEVCCLKGGDIKESKKEGISRPWRLVTF